MLTGELLGNEGTICRVIGLDAENLKRLQEKQPILMTQKDHNMPPKSEILIVYGDTLKELVEILSPFFPKGFRSIEGKAISGEHLNFEKEV